MYSVKAQYQLVLLIRAWKTTPQLAHTMSIQEDTQERCKILLGSTFKYSVTKQILLLLFISFHSCRHITQLKHVINQVKLKPNERNLTYVRTAYTRGKIIATQVFPRSKFCYCVVKESLLGWRLLQVYHDCFQVLSANREARQLNNPIQVFSSFQELVHSGFRKPENSAVLSQNMFQQPLAVETRLRRGSFWV